MSKNKKTALEAASAYLASRMRTVQEVRKRLKDKEYDAAEAEEAVKELIDLGYLDDYAYAMRYYEYNREKRRGSLRAMRELLEKGVAEETVKNAKEDFLYSNKVDEFSDAMTLALRDAEGKETDDKLIAKTARKLESRGFEKRDIIRVLEALRRKGSTEEDY
jgi:regulatory protein